MIWAMYDAGMPRSTQSTPLKDASLLHLIFQSFPETVVIMDAQGVILGVNDQWMALSRLQTHTALLRCSMGSNYLEACRKAGAEGDAVASDVARGLGKTLRHGKKFSLEYHVTTPLGDRWFLLTASPLGEPQQGAIVIHTDITESKRKETHLRETMDHARHEALESQKFRQAVDSATDAIIITDPNARIIYVNPAWIQLTGYTEEESMGQKPSILKSGNTDPEIYRSMWRTIAEGRSFYTDDLQNRRKDGTEFTAEITIFPVKQNGSVVFLVGIQHDVTLRKEADRMKSDFVALVAHQLKTPVSIINGFIKNMLQGVTGPLLPPQREYLEQMLEVSHRNYALINDLLNISRIERGILHVSRSSVSMRALLDRCQREFAVLFRESSVEFVVNPGPEDLNVLVDEEKVVEAMRNVVLNAIRFTQRGHITISAVRGKQFALVTIHDTGSGIAPTELPRLFHRQQILSGGPEAGGGAGLGLYIAKKFLEAQGGDITATSMVDRGSTFTLSLPIAQ